MSRSVRIGVLTPSANTAVEAVMPQILRDIPGVSAHFSRFSVTRTGLDAAAVDQFAARQLVPAALLLADAEVDVIAWAGCSGSWLGPAADVELCSQLTAATSIPSFTATQAIHAAMSYLHVARYGLVAPYQQEMVDAIVGVYAAAGFECSGSSVLDLRTTLDKDRVSPEGIEALVRAASSPSPDAIVVPCTNFRAAPLVAAIEADLGVPIIDSIAATAWRALALLMPDQNAAGWGTLLGGAGGSRPLADEVTRS